MHYVQDEYSDGQPNFFGHTALARAPERPRVKNQAVDPIARQPFYWVVLLMAKLSCIVLIHRYFLDMTSSTAVYSHKFLASFIPAACPTHLVSAVSIK